MDLIMMQELERTNPITQDFTKTFEDVFSKDSRFFFYIIGPPGAGKSTVLARALEIAHLGLEYPPGQYSHRLINRRSTTITNRYPGVYLGKQRTEFSGTDALAMNAITGVVDQMVKHRPPIVVGEGDRLANDRMFRTMKDLGYELTIYHLGCNLPTLKKRLLARGSDQNEQWRKGRTTKANKLAAGWHAIRLNGTLPVDKNAEIIAQAITRAMPMAEGGIAQR